MTANVRTYKSTARKATLFLNQMKEYRNLISVFPPFFSALRIAYFKGLKL